MGSMCLFGVERPALLFHTAVAKFGMQQGISSGIFKGTLFIGSGDGSSKAGCAEVAQAVYTDIGGDLFCCAARGDQFAFLGNIDAEMAGMAQRGSAGTQVNLLHSLMAQGCDQALHGV